MDKLTEQDIERGVCKHHILRRSCDVCDLEHENEELRRWVLWSARRLHKTYKDYVYDGYEELTGEKPERL